MNLNEYQTMFELEDTYWWFVGRRAIIGQLLKQLNHDDKPRRILDLGCGTGANLSLIGKFGKVVGLDASGAALQLASVRNGRLPLAAAPAERLPFHDGSFDLVTCFDVIEHLEDDGCALKEIRRVLRSDGVLLATVPAYPWLWSEHDEALGHYRRYTKASFTRLLRRAGFRPLRLLSAICLPLLPTIALRIMQRAARTPNRQAKTAHIVLPGLLNNALISYLKLEAALLEKANLPFGLSLVTIARPSSRVQK